MRAVRPSPHSASSTPRPKAIQHSAGVQSRPRCGRRPIPTPPLFRCYAILCGAAAIGAGGVIMKKAGAFRRGRFLANRSPAPAHRDPLGYSGISPYGGMFVKKSAITSGGAGLLQGLSKHAYPAGADFCSCKSQQNTLGALPQDPWRWLCWIRIDLRREPKINPYCAQNRSQGSRSASALSPHPLSRGGKGARMGG